MPLLAGVVSDLFFTVPIENVARALGYTLHWLEQADLSGADFIAQMVDEQPALLIVDLNTPLPWEEWVVALKTSPATRRLPVLAFGSHTDVALRTRATAAGCDAIVAKGRFLSALPDLITKHARRIDEAALEAECATPLSDLALKGIKLFNRREFFEAHEELELAWNADPGPARELYRGVLQVAVAYLQIERRNYAGALKMFLRVRQWLDPLPAVCRGIEVAQLRADAAAARAALEALGPERLAEFDRELLRPVKYVLL